MILDKSSPHYKELPGLSVLIGGMWIANLSYWGFNQYIIQRALAAKSLAEAQKGVVFAAYLKLLMPVIVVLPGIAAVMLAPGLEKPDQAYPTMLRYLPAGILGLVFSALVAAIIASTASKINSIATIFTLDIYAKFRRDPDAPAQEGEIAHPEVDEKAPAQAQREKELVLVGRITRLRRDRHRHPGRPAAARQVGAGLPVHPGIHRLLHARDRRHVPARPVLEAGDRMAARSPPPCPRSCSPGSASSTGRSLPFMDRMGLVFLAALALAVIVSLLRPSQSARRTSSRWRG